MKCGFETFNGRLNGTNGVKKNDAIAATGSLFQQ
jgi:hypothetical protein